MPSEVAPVVTDTSMPSYVAVEAKIRDAGQGVRAVGRGRAAGHDFDLRQQRRRNVVDVHAAVAIGRREPGAVEQDQRACRPHRAQIDDASAGAAEQCAAAALRALRLENCGS